MFSSEPFSFESPCDRWRCRLKKVSCTTSCASSEEPQAHQISQQRFAQLSKQSCSLSIASSKARERQSPRHRIATHRVLDIARLLIEQFAAAIFRTHHVNRLRYNRIWTLSPSYHGSRY